MFVYLQKDGGIVAEKAKARHIITVITCVRGLKAVLESVDISPYAEMVNEHSTIERVDRAIFVIDRRGDKRRTHGTVEIVPTISEHTVSVIAVIACVA